MKTLILGATPNPERYAYLAAEKLVRYGHEIVPVGIKQGEVQGKAILNGKPELQDIDTVTMYIGEVIFNPGTENPRLEEALEAKGIEVVEGCTLVMLGAKTF
jgi:uncharacterized protein